MSITYPLAIPFTANKTRLTLLDTVGESISPFSLKAQTYDWLADRLGVELSFPPMKRVKAAQMAAFMASMRGKAATFLAGDPMCPSPQGVATGTPLVNGTNTARSATLAIKGWTNSVTGILKAGDWIQVTASGKPQRIYMNLKDLNSDGSGHATLDIFPRLREDLSDGTAIVISSPKGTFRISTNQRQWDIETYLMASFTLSGIEAI